MDTSWKGIIRSDNILEQFDAHHGFETHTVESVFQGSQAVFNYYRIVQLLSLIIHPFQTQQKDHLKEFQSDSSVKLALLTTIEDMAVLNYPIHDLEQDNIVGLSPVVPSRKQYAKVTADSPIFALDCEMCVTDISKHELTRVTLVFLSSFLTHQIALDR